MTSDRHTAAFRPPVALTIAGTDPSGGAGVQADLKTFTARGVYGASVITALVAQNTHGVHRIYDIDEDFILDQFTSVLDDIHIDASKTGMLSSPHMIDTIAGFARAGKLGFLVTDPVMVATSGHALLSEEAIVAVREKLLPAADLITPNLPEAALLLGQPVAETPHDMREQAAQLLSLGPRAVLLKGGHATAATVTDVLAVQGAGGDGVVWRELTHPRIHSPNTHGTGCTLSAAIAAEVAVRRRGLQAVGEDPSTITVEALTHAVSAALDYVARAISGAAEWHLALEREGAHGPVDHTVDIVRSFKGDQ